jgi:ribonuclease VapC
VVIDSSVLLAIARREDDASTFERLLVEADIRSISAATVLEASLVLHEPHGQQFLDVTISGMEVVPFDERQLAVAREAHRRFGRGSGHRAGLNLGDCFSYALAITTGEPLLFKGDDFRHTDVVPAHAPD